MVQPPDDRPAVTGTSAQGSLEPVEGQLFHRALLLEDEAAHALLVQRALKTVVGDVVRVSSVPDGCEALRNSLEPSAIPFDIIISDLNLPGAPSGGPVAAIRECVPRIPLLVLTSSSSVSDGVAAMRAGANDFLVKNFDASFKDVLQLTLSRLFTAGAIERERQELTRDRDILRLAVENSDDGLAVVEPDGRVRHCNTAFRRILSAFGASSDNVLAMDPAAISHGETILQTVREKLRDLSGASVWTTELLAQEGGDLAYDLSLSAAGNGSGTQVTDTFVIWVRDICERKRRERFQREILSTTTHDLKGPLGAISISCDVLLDKQLEDKKTRDVLERISSSASSAIHLIEEFLSARRIEEGTFVLRPRTLAIAPVLERCVESFTLPYETRGITLSWASEARGSAHASPEATLGCVDELGFERIISNLLSNAMKFTPRGGQVRVETKRLSHGLVVSVRDSGSGMEPAEAQTLFQRYSRLSKHASVAGTGLGLFIVKSIVSAHGGTINVTSAVGQGTTFDLFFPDAPPVDARGELLCLDFA